MSDKPLAKKTLFFYGLSEMPISIASLPLLAFIPNYYVSDLGLDFAAVALVMLLARSFDAVTDPLIGFLSDRPILGGAEGAYGCFFLYLF